ncbi:hypothetical protein GCM10020331_082000 [Ectobacillus funiculus]
MIGAEMDEKYVERLKTISVNPELATEMGEELKKLFSRRYMEHLISRFAKLYKHLVIQT